MLDVKPHLFPTDFPSIQRSGLAALQVNLGYKCNLSCTHCHVAAGPTRTELMDKENIERILAILNSTEIKQLDLTGGAPEMNPHFRYLVAEARKLNVEVTDRCNLTVLFEEEYEGTAEFLADQQVVVTASLPCYEQDNVDKQRGKGVYDLSIKALKKLNSLGYGLPDSNLVLNLVYNPGGPSLPPNQTQLQAAYKEELRVQHGIEFNELFTITNMPISRFGSMLLSKKQFSSYLNLLKDNYSPQNLTSVMCKTLVSVDWQGYVYDCDFNQMLEMKKARSGYITSDGLHLRDLLNDLDEVEKLPIMVGEHCYGCTAGQGSSCGGAL